MEVLRPIEPTSPQKGPQKMDHPLPSAFLTQGRKSVPQFHVSSLHLQSPLEKN